MRVETINPFLNATISVLETMAFVTPEAGKPYLKQVKVATGDVSSIVGITGKPDATFAISFDRESIFLIIDKMLGKKLLGITQEVGDAIGEIAKMISGTAIRDLANHGIYYDNSIPSVIVGKNHELKHISDGPIIAVPFKLETGLFTVELCFRE